MIKKQHGLVFQVYESRFDSSSADQDNKFHRRRAGGHRIANFLRSHDWDVEVIDFAAMFSFEELQELCRSRITKKTKFIGFSCIFQSWPIVIDKFASWFKKNYPDIKIIWGGGYIIPPDVDSIDFYITGYGENALLNLLKVISGNSLVQSITFDSRFKNKKVICADKTCPAFPMHQLSNTFEDRDFVLPEEWGHIELSRGCIFKCKFCSYPVLGVKGDYTQDAEDFRKSLQINHDRYGISNYYVVDETFNDSTDKISKYADQVEKLSFVPFFSGFIRADLLLTRPEDKHHLLRMNFLGHYYGIESFNDKTAKTIGKGMPSEKLKQGLVDIKNFFQQSNRKIYRGSTSMIVGLPFETPDSLQNSIDWHQQHWNDQHCIWNALYIPSFNSAIPGMNDQMSIIGLNLKKFNYESLGTFDHLGTKWINWKNKDFTTEQAVSMCFSLAKNWSGSGTGNLTLDDLIYQKRTIDHALSTVTTDEQLAQAQDYKYQIVQQYKQKKLSI